MTLYDRRVEAVAKKLAGEDRGYDFYKYPHTDRDRDDYRAEARAALRAADAVCCAHPKCPGGSLCCCQADVVVTEEMIAEEIAGHPIGSGFYQTTVGVGEAREMAEAIRALFGEVAGNE